MVITNSTEMENKTAAAVHQPLFSIEVFMYLMTFVTVLSGIAFYLLNIDSIISKCLAHPTTEVKPILLNNHPRTQFYNSTGGEETTGEGALMSNVVNTDSYPVLVDPTTENLQIPKSESVSLMILLTMICILANGVFPSIQSYSCLPYGYVTYHWAVTLSAMANPSVCFLMLFLKKPIKAILIFASIGSFAVGSYILSTGILIIICFPFI